MDSYKSHTCSKCIPDIYVDEAYEWEKNKQKNVMFSWPLLGRPVIGERSAWKRVYACMLKMLLGFIANIQNKKYGNIQI